MKKILVSIISLTLLGCLNISEAESENFDEKEERTKNLEDSIVGLIETGVNFLNNELKKELNEKNHTNELKAPIPPKFELKQKEEVEYDYLADITGVWSESGHIYGTTVFEINFIDSLKTLNYIYTPSDFDRNLNDSVDINYLYDVSIKNIDNKKHTVSFYLTKKGKGFKEPMRKNPIWTIRLNPRNDSYISLTTNKGKKYQPYYVREY